MPTGTIPLVSHIGPPSPALAKVLDTSLLHNSFESAKSADNFRLNSRALFPRPTFAIYLIQSPAAASHARAYSGGRSFRWSDARSPRWMDFPTVLPKEEIIGGIQCPWHPACGICISGAPRQATVLQCCLWLFCRYTLIGTSSIRLRT